MRRRAPSGADYTENTSVLTRDGRGETPTRGGSPPCSNASPTEPAEWSCWRKKKRACSTTTTSGPSTSCSASSTRVRASPPRRSSRSASRSRPCAPRSRRSSVTAAPSPSGHIPFTPRAKKVLELSLREALQLGHNYIGTEHILLGLIREGEGVAAQVLVKLGADLSRVRQQVIQLLSGYAGAKEGAPQGGGRRHRDRPGRLARARPVRSQPHPARPRARSSTRSSGASGDRARHAGAVAPHQEQPGADRRARRRQDRHRRGPGHRHRRRRRARDAPGQAALHARPRRAGGRLPLPRRLRGAPQEGAEGDPHPRRHHPVHRRAAHARRCGCRRGRDRRRQHPQADARPR